MRSTLILSVCCVACIVAGGVGVRYGAEVLSLGAVMPTVADPQDGSVADGVYRNTYFDLSYPLPAGWTEGVAGPDPSATGYYVLQTLVPKGELSATILIAAQDMFFAGEEPASLAVMTDALRHAMSQVDGMSIDAEPTALEVAGRAMHRIDFSGAGLHRSLVATEIRCHLVTFTLTARDPEALASLRLSLNRLATAAQGRASASAPPCIRDYVVTDNLVERVEPDVSGATFDSIPVRLVIGADGAVKHVHVIRALPSRRKALETALRQWRFKPPRIDGRPTDIETSLLFKSAVAAR
jgi:hypothetical protein